MTYFFKAGGIICLISAILLFLEPFGSHAFLLVLVSLIVSLTISLISGVMILIRNKKGEE
ncbi:MAG: hypothetical protein LKJ88_05490 [Bacilli bacterium]|nr:hypothetical protein [Bacilli bacterium]